MNFGICRLNIREIEKLRCDSMCLFMFEESFPLMGLSGIVDWRMCGMISKLLKEGTIRGGEKESFLVPTRPRLPVEKLFGFGMGKVHDFHSARVEEIVEEAFSVLKKASVHSTSLQLPGRCRDLYPLEEAARIIRKILEKKYDIDELVVIDRFNDPEKDLALITRGLDF